MLIYFVVKFVIYKRAENQSTTFMEKEELYQLALSKINELTSILSPLNEFSFAKVTDIKQFNCFIF